MLVNGTSRCHRQRVALHTFVKMDQLEVFAKMDQLDAFAKMDQLDAFAKMDQLDAFAKMHQLDNVLKDLIQNILYCGLTLQEILELFNYRVFQCDALTCNDINCGKIKHNMGETKCNKYHYLSHRRRIVVYQNGIPNYTCDKYCTLYSIYKGMCLFGDKCKYLHHNINDTEFLFHPEMIKRFICILHYKGLCKNLFCVYSHNKYDGYKFKSNYKTKCEILGYDVKWKNMNIILREYKTQKCSEQNCINIYLCPYYHNSGDRRKINTVLSQCPKAENCTDEKCKLCHNKCEYQYHPSIYKTFPCVSSDYRRCSNDWFCQYIHEIEPSLGDKDVLPNVLNSVLRFENIKFIYPPVGLVTPEISNDDAIPKLSEEAKECVRYLQLEESQQEIKLIETKKCIAKILNGICSVCLIGKANYYSSCGHIITCINCVNKTLICKYCFTVMLYPASEMPTA